MGCYQSVIVLLLPAIPGGRRIHMQCFLDGEQWLDAFHAPVPLTTAGGIGRCCQRGQYDVERSELTLGESAPQSYGIQVLHIINKMLERI